MIERYLSESSDGKIIIQLKQLHPKTKFASLAYSTELIDVDVDVVDDDEPLKRRQRRRRRRRRRR